MSHGSIRGREFLGHDDHTFQFFEARQVLVEVFDEAFIQRLYLGVRNQGLPGSELNLVRARPLFQKGEVRRDQHGGKLPPVATTTAVPISGFSFRELSIGCGAMNFPPEVLIRSFLRSVMERYPSLSRHPMSPVLNQPSTKALRVSSGRFQ